MEKPFIIMAQVEKHPTFFNLVNVKVFTENHISLPETDRGDTVPLLYIVLHSQNAL